MMRPISLAWRAQRLLGQVAEVEPHRERQPDKHQHHRHHQKGAEGSLFARDLIAEWDHRSGVPAAADL